MLVFESLGIFLKTLTFIYLFAWNVWLSGDFTELKMMDRDKINSQPVHTS